MRNLSKSKLLAYRQCPKRLWLEIHRPELREDTPDAQARFAVGHRVGEIARQFYDPSSKGLLLDAQRDGYEPTFARSTELLGTSQPIFEAGFAAGGAFALADVMLPVRKAGQRAWRMIEVKSSTSVKDYHRDDVAVQAYVARTAGVRLESIAVAHIDSTWVYPGGTSYQGLLKEADLTAEAISREAEVETWIGEAQAIAAKRKEPAAGTGRHCGEPFECGFLAYCQQQDPNVEFPVEWLPRVQTRSLKAWIAEAPRADLREVPDELLNERQQRVKTHTLSGKTYFDAKGAADDLAPNRLPAYFLDFETIQFAVPIWVGTRPYQQIPYQFSLHRLSRSGQLEQRDFLDLSGADPSAAFAKALVAACEQVGPVYVYNAGFETARIKELAARFPRLKQALLAINERVVDLQRVAERRYYHPSQQGSWSIKCVLPCIAPHLSYDALEGVQDGGMATTAFLEAIDPQTPSSRKAQIEGQLRKYCGLDTFAMVEVWRFFSGRTDLKF